MAYLGKDITYGHLKGQTETGNGSTAAYDLDYTINDGHAVSVYVGNVHQEPDVGYTVTGGGTSITFTEDVPNGERIYIRYLGIQYDTVNVENNHITSAKIATNAVTTSEIADNAVSSVKIAENAVTAREISTNAVTTLYIADNSVTSIKIAENNVTSRELAGTISGDHTFSGSTTFSGTVVTANTTNVTVTDPLMILAHGQSGSAAYDSGFIVERGSDNNAGFIWDESADEFALISNTNSTGTETGDVTISAYGNLRTLNTAVTGTLGVTGAITGTLGTAAQTNITSVGTLTALTVDNLGVNGNTITANSGALNLTPASGSAIVLDVASFEFPL